MLAIRIIIIAIICFVVGFGGSFGMVVLGAKFGYDFACASTPEKQDPPQVTFDATPEITYIPDPLPSECDGSCILPKVYTMRVTGYVANGENGCLAKPVRPGKNAAVSYNCIGLLGEKVYIDGHGVWEVNDRTADWLDDEHDVCTIDLAKPTEKSAMAVGNEHKTVIRITKWPNWRYDMELKNCPFCGGDGVVVTDETADACVYCSICFAEIKLFRRGVIALDTHVNWNTRPIEDSLRNTIERVTIERDFLCRELGKGGTLPPCEMTRGGCAEYCDKYCEDMEESECWQYWVENKAIVVENE